MCFERVVKKGKRLIESTMLLGIQAVRRGAQVTEPYEPWQFDRKVRYLFERENMYENERIWFGMDGRLSSL